MAQDRFRFRKHATIGAADAEDDQTTLRECFVDTGDLKTLADCKHPTRIVIGRTGSGKTALLTRLAESDTAVCIQPETLSFPYITNSTILTFFLEAGVKLDLFFKLLWRHVLTVELLKKRFNIVNETAKQTFREKLAGIFLKDAKKKRAVEYIENWGTEFWQPTEYRIKEITSRVEQNLTGSLQTTIPGIELKAGAAGKLGEEQRAEVQTRGQEIINGIQMRELTDILEFLDEDVFDDEQRPYYICIDRLDEDWVEEKFRYLLIRSLVETVREFRRVRNVKVIIALRSDLLDRMFRITRDAGFQEEKYRSLYLRLKWSDPQLKSILDKRVSFLVKQTYASAPVGYADVLPKEVRNTPVIEYLLDRTLRRPRELIEFFNDCIELAADRPTITQQMVLRAESKYSRDRLRSLQDEWHTDYPRLIEFCELLHGKPPHFKLSSIATDDVEEWCLELATSMDQSGDRMTAWARSVAEGEMSGEQFTQSLFHVLYKTGVVGIKLSAREQYQWAYEGIAAIPALGIGRDTGVAIHPSFYRTLAIKQS